MALSIIKKKDIVTLFEEIRSYKVDVIK